MKKTLLLVTLLLATSSFGWAGACSSAPMTSYLVAGFSCTETIGTDTLTFSNFLYTSGGTNPVPVANVGVTALGDGFGFGLLSGAPWSVSSNQTLDATVIYTVSGDLDIIKLDLENFGRTNAGAILATENIAATGFFGSQKLHDNSKVNDCASQGNTKCVSSLTLPEIAGPFRIQKDLVLSADGVNSSAFVGTLSNEFNAIPEPGSMLLFGSGLLALGGYIRRRQRR